MKRNWVPRHVDKPEILIRLQQELNNLPEALARVLVLRGIESFETARQFFRPSLSDLHDPFLMKDMDVAADRLAEAVMRREKVLVYGDYDVDGTTSTALMVSFLRERGVDTEFFIPDRIEHGYGLGPSGIDTAVRFGASLIVALDCGITAVNEAEYARDRKLDLIICDHHKPDLVIPRATGVLNPKRIDCPYPFKELSGCGVGFKLIQAVLTRLGETPDNAYSYLDLVAISIASDIVPLAGENRVLMIEGLRVLGQGMRVGLRKLAEKAGMDLTDCSTSRIVFGLGPRINAAGRMGDARRAVELLLERDAAAAADLAEQLEQANNLRRSRDRDTLVEALQQAQDKSYPLKNTLVLYRPEWHLGVLGIVASRLVEQYYRPVIMLAASNGHVKGSARSIQGLSIYNALRECGTLLTTFGGHEYAAGLSLSVENVPAFQRRFDEVVSEVITDELLTPSISVDASLNLNDIDKRFWAVLRQFAPHGPDNETPVFHARSLEVLHDPQSVGKNGDHLKFHVRHIDDPDSPSLEVVGFGMRDHRQTVRDSRRSGIPLELLFSVQENNWNGRTTLQLRARDLRME